MFILIYLPQVKRVITPRFITSTILGYTAVQAAAFLSYVVLYQLNFRIVADPASYFVDNATRLKWIPSVLNKSRFLIITLFRTQLVALYLSNNFLYGIVILETTLLIIIFKRSVKDRKAMLGDKKPNDTAKEKRLIQSVIAVCAIYIVTAFPKTLLRVNYSLRFSPYLSLTTIQRTLEFFDLINHSVNIFVYLKMNRRFRDKFISLFCSKRNKRSSDKSKEK